MNPDERSPDPAAAFPEPWVDPDRDYAAGELPLSHDGLAGQVEKRVLGVSRLVDRLQSRFSIVAFGYGVLKKYSDDEGSRLAALLAYYTFLSIFPLLVGGLAIADMILSGNPQLVDKLLVELVPPDYQQQVADAYHGLPSSGSALAIALIGLLLSGTGAVFSLYAAVNQIYAVPYRFRFGFGPRYARVLLIVLLLFAGAVLMATATALIALLPDWPQVRSGLGFIALWLVVFMLLYAGAKVLCRRPLGFGEVGLGAILGGFWVSVCITLGSLIVGKFVANSSAVYGAFATVVGFISVLFLVSNGVVICYEISVVRAWQLWPRGVDINLLFPADERAYALLTLMDERMPSQRNGVVFDAEGHDDPRRAAPDTLTRRQPGIPKRPYDVGG